MWLQNFKMDSLEKLFWHYPEEAIKMQFSCLTVKPLLKTFSPFHNPANQPHLFRLPQYDVRVSPALPTILTLGEFTVLASSSQDFPATKGSGYAGWGF